MQSQFRFLFLSVIVGCTTDRAGIDDEATVFRHHPGLILNQDESEGAEADVGVLFAAMRAEGIQFSYGGGLGQGYFLAIPREGMCTWQVMVAKLIRGRKLRYYTDILPDKNQCGFLHVP